MVVVTGELAVGAVMAAVGAVVSGTVTVTEEEVPVLLAASRATALRVWLPGAAVVVSHVTEYGDVVSSAPRGAPSSWNWTPTTPTLSEALAVTAMLPVTVAPELGAVMLTVGAAVSGTVTVTALDVAMLFAASQTLSLHVALPSSAVVVSHVTEYGDVVSSAPRLAPSSWNWTPTTPTSSEALAVTVMMPVTVAPALGEVML